MKLSLSILLIFLYALYSAQAASKEQEVAIDESNYNEQEESQGFTDINNKEVENEESYDEYAEDEEESLPEIGSDEYYDDYRWVSMTSDGQETEGTLEEAKAMISGLTYEDEEEKEDEEEDDPATSPFKVDADEDESDDDPKQQKVFPPDTRRKVSPVRRFPWTAMGRLRGSTGSCSGTMIGRRTVLTAAHCFYSKSTRKWATNIYFHRAKDCDPNQGFQVRYTRAVTYRAWTRRFKWRFDIGIVILRSNSPVWMSYGYTTRRFLRRNTAYTAGYPGDKSGRCLWYTHCRITGFRAFGTHLIFKCDTYPGNSGGPVYMFRRGRRIIYGVVSYQTGSYNGNVRVTRKHFRNIGKWIRKYNGH